MKECGKIIEEKARRQERKTEEQMLRVDEIKRVL